MNRAPVSSDYIGMQRDTQRILDEYLVVLSRTGSQTAFDELARRWMPRVLRYAARTLGAGRDSTEQVRDVVQETWLGVVRGLRGLEDPAQFPAWIYAITTRKCVDAIRTAARQRRLGARLEADGGTDGGAGNDKPERHVDLESAIARLPEDQRKVVHLYYGEDLGIAEIAAACDIPAGTVKSRLHHAREALKRHFQSNSTMSQIGRTRHERHR